MLNYKRVTALLLAVLLISLYGCSKGGGTSSELTPSELTPGDVSASGSESDPTSTPVPGSAENQTHSVSYAISQLPQTLDTSKSLSSFDAQFIYNTCEGLVRLYNNEIKPGIAEKWDVSEDGKTYTFHLRSAYWEDGNLITAADFEYTLKRIFDRDDALFSPFMVIKNAEAYCLGNANLSDVGVCALGEQTLEIKLEEPAPYLLSLLANSILAYPLREDVVEKSGEDYAKNTGTYLSCGPFRIKSWTSDAIVLEKNPTYWNADAVTLGTVTCYAVPDGTTRALMYENKELDLYMEVLKSNEALYSSPKTTVEGTLVALQLNFSGTSEDAGKLLSNKNFRLALSTALNREALTAQYAMKGSVATNRFTAPNIRGVSGSYISENPLSGVSLTAEASGAKTYLQAALSELGMSADSLPALTFVAYDNTVSAPLAQAMVDTWKSTLGLSNISLVTLPAADAVKKCLDRKYDLYLQISSTEYPDPYAQLSLWRSDSPVNWTGYSDEAYDKLLDAANALSDPAQRFTKLAEAEKYLMDNGPILPIYFRGYLYNFSRTVSGVGISGAGVNIQLIYADN